MQAVATRIGNLRQGRQPRGGGQVSTSIRRRPTNPAHRAAAGYAAAPALIAPHTAFAIPSLFGVEKEYAYQDSTPIVCSLAKSLLRAGIATQEHWEASKKRPLWFIQQALRGVMEAAGGKDLHNHFVLGAMVTESLDMYTSHEPREDRLYIIMDGDQPTMLRIGEVYEDMAQLHERLPVTFWSKFVCHGFGRFFRVVDQEDVQQQIENLEELGEGEELKQAKSMKADLPLYMRERMKPLSDRTYREILHGLSPRTKLSKMLAMADEIERVAAAAGRVQLDDYDEEGLYDLGECYPILSLHFGNADLVRGAVDEVVNTVMQSTASPNVIIPFNPLDTESVRAAFGRAGTIGKVIGLSAQLTYMLPYVDE